MMFSALKKNKEAPRISYLSKSLFAISVLVSLFCYYVLLSHKSAKASSISGELSLNPQSSALTSDGSFLGFLFSYFGSFSYVLPLFIIYCGYVFFIKQLNFKRIDLFNISLRILGFNLLVIGLTSTFSFCFSLDETGGGGVLGDFLNIVFRSFAPGLLGTVLSVLLSLIGISLFVAMSPLAMLDKIGGSITSLFGAKNKESDIKKEQEPIINTSEHSDDGRKFGIAKVFNSAGSIPSFKGKKENASENKEFTNNSSDRLEPVFDSKNTNKDVVDIENIDINERSETSSTLINDNKETHNFKNPQEPSFGDNPLTLNNDNQNQERLFSTNNAEGSLYNEDSVDRVQTSTNFNTEDNLQNTSHFNNENVNDVPQYLDSNFRPNVSDNDVHANNQRATYIAPREPLDGSQSSSYPYDNQSERSERSTYIIDNTRKEDKSSFVDEDNTPNTYIINRAEQIRQDKLRQEAYEREQQEALIARNQGNDNFNDNDGEIHSIITDRSALTEALLQKNQEKIQRQREELYKEQSLYENANTEKDASSTIITHRDPNAYNPQAQMNHNINVKDSYNLQESKEQKNVATTTTHQGAGSYTVNLGSFDTFSASIDNSSNTQNLQQNETSNTTDGFISRVNSGINDNIPGYIDPHAAFTNSQSSKELQNINGNFGDSERQSIVSTGDNGAHSIDSNNSPSYLDVKKSFGFADESQDFENVISFEDNKDVSDKFEGKGYEVGDNLPPAFTPNINAIQKDNDDKNILNRNKQSAISEKDASYEYHRASRGVFGSDSSENNVENYTNSLDDSHKNSSLSAKSTMDYTNNQSNFSQKENSSTYYSPNVNSSNDGINNQENLNRVQTQDQYQNQENTKADGYVQYQANNTLQSGVEDRSFGNNSDYKAGFVEQNSSANNYPSYMQDERVNDNSLTTIQIPFKSNVVTAPNHVYDEWRPDVNLLTPSHSQDDVDTEALNQMAAKIDAALSSFGVKAHVERYVTGPVITRYELSLAPGIKSSAISSISVDLGRTLTVGNVRVIDVIPGTSYVGIELPNKNRKLITLYDVASKRDFIENEYKLPLCLGCSVTGDPVVVDLVKAPHLLIAGTTGSGKSAGLNAMLVSMLLKKSPEELRLILIDPKRVEFSLYNSLPHLITPIISDVADKAAAALRWCVEEMERRYQLIEDNEVRKLDEYNAKIKEAAARGEVLYDKSWTADKGGNPPILKPLPLLVVVIEEYADLVAQTSGGRKKNENSPEQYINRLAAKARAAGIHLILATQSPRSDVLTGVIKNNIPARIAFTVQSMIDSRVILDEGGAEKLLGNGDMLCKFTSINQGVSFRCHGAFVSNDDVDRVVESWREHGETEYIDDVTEEPVEEVETIEDKGGNDKRDKKLEEAASFALEYYSTHQKYPPISDFQIMLGVGYPRAKKIYIQLQKEGIIN